MSTKQEDKKQEDKEEESSFSWKKNGFDIREHLTLKNDSLEADVYQDKQKKEKNRKNKEKVLPIGFQKLRKKIREVYDEDDEDEEDAYTYTFMPMNQIEDENEDSRLLKGLTDDEKNALKEKETLKIVRSQQDAGKMEAMHIAHNLAKEAGLNGLDKKTVARGMQEAIFEPEKMQEKVIKKDVSKKLGIRGDIEKGKIIQAARGIKKVENLGGQKATKNLDMKDIVKAGEEKLNEAKLAELILEKSGQDVKKRKKNMTQSKEKVDLKYLKDKDAKERENSKEKKKNKDNLEFSISQNDFSR